MIDNIKTKNKNNNHHNNQTKRTITFLGCDSIELNLVILFFVENIYFQHRDEWGWESRYGKFHKYDYLFLIFI